MGKRNMTKRLSLLLATLVFLLAPFASASAQKNQLLQPDRAFPFSAKALGPTTIRAIWDIAPGYHLNRNTIRFETDSPGVKLGAPRFPPGKVEHDPYLGRIEVYHGKLTVDVPVRNGTGTKVELIAHYQGCADRGICYRPITHKVAVNLPASGAPGASGSKGFVSKQDRLANFLVNKPLWVSIGIFFLAGLALAFTPCVFPMIPILSSIIVGHGEKITTRHAFLMSLTYVLALALTYTGTGIVIALLGDNLQAAFQNPWVLSSFAAVFVLLSLAMFGFYELQMPNAIQSRLSSFSNRQHGGTFAGVAIMGVLSALIVGPCVAAPLVAALLVISQTGNVVLGGTALFALGMGMGAPLIIIGTSAGKFLPRAGAWMDVVKAVFGVLLLGLAIWMLARILPTAVTMALWAVLLIISAVYMGALEPLREGASGWYRLWKGVGLVLMVYGTLLLIGAAAGSNDYLQPLRGIFAQSSGGPAGTVAEAKLQFRPVKTLQELEREIAAAAAQNKPVMLDFTADWCVSCKEYETHAFSDPRVKRLLQGVVLLQADVTTDNDTTKALLQHFHLIGPPSILFFGPDGKERKNYRLVGYLDPEQFRAHLEKALG